MRTGCAGAGRLCFRVPGVAAVGFAGLLEIRRFLCDDVRRDGFAIAQVERDAKIAAAEERIAAANERYNAAKKN